MDYQNQVWLVVLSTWAALFLLCVVVFVGTVVWIMFTDEYAIELRRDWCRDRKDEIALAFAIGVIFICYVAMMIWEWIIPDDATAWDIAAASMRFEGYDEVTIQNEIGPRPVKGGEQ
jgi:hypothetical protein